MKSGRPLLEGAPSAPSSSECVAIVTIIVLAVSLAISFSNPAITGLYHDDGIYLATARSLAEAGTYRLINLPGAPAATKYPPLYPAALAVAWTIKPSFPENLAILKGVNAACLGVLLLIVWRWTLRFGGIGPRERILAVALAATAPGLFSFTDLILSDLLFATLFVGVLLAYPRDPRTSAVQPILTAALLAGLAGLTRTVGVAIGLGIILHLLSHGTWRRALAAAAVIAACLVPWELWSLTARAANPNPLLRYYLSYEPSAWSDSGLRTHLVSVLTANARFFATQGAIPFGLSGPVIGTIGVTLITMGLLRAELGNLQLPAYIAAIYAAASLGHPYPMVRYLVPWVPIAYVAVARGVAALQNRPAVGGLALVPAVLLLFTNVMWLGHYRAVTATGVHGEFGRALPFEWAGYRETAEWIGRQTATDARVASGDDTLYFLYAGRRAVRPWIHQPERYTPGFGLGPPRPDPAFVQRALDDLGARYLVIDPQLSGGEAEFARQSLESLLRRPGSPWTLRFTSENRKHRVYERQPIAVSNSR